MRQASSNSNFIYFNKNQFVDFNLLRATNKDLIWGQMQLFLDKNAIKCSLNIVLVSTCEVKLLFSTRTQTFPVGLQNL
jgi:hypothetical protein